MRRSPLSARAPIDGADGSCSRHRNVPHWVLSTDLMKEITTVGFDLTKNAVGAERTVVIRHQLGRAQLLLFFSRLAPCLIGIEQPLATPGRIIGHESWRSSAMRGG